MDRRSPDARGHAADRLVRSLALSTACTLCACITYEPAPLDVHDLLADLEDVSRPADGEGATAAQLAAFAVEHHPDLRAARARAGIARALLVEAGLLADPEVGWDGMDALASRIVEGNASRVDFLSGLSLSVPLPRPGEVDARERAARWRLEESRQSVIAAEWRLAHEVHLAVEDARAARELLRENQLLSDIADATLEFFERARDAGAATGLQAHLAAGDALNVRAERLRLEARLRAAMLHLDALLGLPPHSEVRFSQGATIADLPAVADEAALVRRALDLRPDLAVLLSSYEAAEQDVRLEVARQVPPLAIGTGLWVVPGFRSRFGRPAIDTAIARRAAVGASVEALVHTIRDEVTRAASALDEARREVAFLEGSLLPNAEEGLRLAREAFDAGEVSFLEISTAQRSLIEARRRTTEGRAEVARRTWDLFAASGSLLADGGADSPATETAR